MRDIMTLKRNRFLLKNMHQVDLETHNRTDALYVPKDTTVAQMDAAWLKRNLCHAAQGNIEACRACPAPCMIGKALERSVVGG